MKKESMVGRRLYAKIIDTLLLIILVFLVDGLISQPLNKKTTDIDSVSNSYAENSKVYEAIQDEYNIYIYDQNNNRIYNENVTEDIKNEFLNDERIIELNVVLFEQQKELLLNLVLRIAFSIFIPAFLIYGILPIIFKDGKTLGRFFAKLVVIDKKGRPINWFRTFCRALVGIMINIYLALLSLGIIPLISLLISIGHKNNKSIVDLICNTRVIDGKLPYIFEENK